MIDHSACQRQFIQFNRAWYAEANRYTRSDDFIDEIMLGFYHPDGGTTGEFSLTWINLSGTTAVQLNVYDDAWDALWQCRDLLESLAVFDKGKNQQVLRVDECCTLLQDLGFIDATPEECPYE